MADQKYWVRVFKDTNQRSKYREGNLILVGKPGCGSKHLISSLQQGPGSLGKSKKYSQLISPDDPIPVSCPLQYSYINSKDIQDPQSDKISMINIYTLEIPELKHLLGLALNPKTLDKTLFGIVLDWEQPWRFRQDLEIWIEIWHEMLGKAVSLLPLEEQDNLVKSVSDYVKKYRDPDLDSESSEIQDVTLAEGVLQVNMGVPIMVICCKSDLVWTVDKNREQNDKILDSNLNILREFCVNYGASLFYTSSKYNINISVLYDYIMHRIYGFPLLHKANIVAKDQIFIPSGWDSPSLIQQTNYLSSDKQLSDCLPRIKSKMCKKEEVQVVDDQDFIMQIKGKLKDTGRERTNRIAGIIAPKIGGLTVEDSEQIMKALPEQTVKYSQSKLQEFYKNLLGKSKED